MESTSVERRLTHTPFYGLVLPIEHEFWTKIKPGDEWGCKCGLAATDAERTPEDQIPPYSNYKPTKGLDNNPAHDSKLFNDTHPYFPSKCDGCVFNVNKKNKPNIFFNQTTKDCYDCKGINNIVNNLIEQLNHLKKITAELRDAIYALDYDRQFISIATNEKGFNIYKHLLVSENKTDYQELLQVANKFALDGDVWINPEIHSKAISARQKIYLGNDFGNSNPDLRTHIGFIEVKSPNTINNFSYNAGQGIKQGDFVTLTDLRLTKKLTERNINYFIRNLWKNKEYTKDQVYLFIDGELIKLNRPQ